MMYVQCKSPWDSTDVAVVYNLWLKYMFMKYLDGLNPLKITAKMEKTLEEDVYAFLRKRNL